MRALKLRFPDRGQDMRSGGYAVLLLGILSLLGVLYQFKEAMDEVAYWDLRIAAMDRRVERKGGPIVLSGREGGHTKKEIQRANAILREIDLPWEALFDSLEYAAGHDVALLTFQPDAAGRKVLIGGEAKDLPALLDFIGALEREPVLKDAHLIKYEIKRDDSQRPLVFSITSSWIEAS